MAFVCFVPEWFAYAVIGVLLLVCVGIGALIAFLVRGPALPKRRVRIEDERGSRVHTVRGWRNLMRLLDPEHRQFLDRIIRDTHSSGLAVSCDAIAALGYSRSKRALACLQDVLTEDPRMLQREAAAESLGRLGSLAARRILQRALDSAPPEQVRHACATALEEYRAG